MTFKVGETVVYPHHGAAVIEAIEERLLKGVKKTYLRLKVAQGDLTVLVPAENAEVVGVRDVVDEHEFGIRGDGCQSGGDRGLPGSAAGHHPAAGQPTRLGHVRRRRDDHHRADVGMVGERLRCPVQQRAAVHLGERLGHRCVQPQAGTGGDENGGDGRLTVRRHCCVL